MMRTVQKDKYIHTKVNLPVSTDWAFSSRCLHAGYPGHIYNYGLRWTWTELINLLSFTRFAWSTLYHCNIKQFSSQFFLWSTFKDLMSPQENRKAVSLSTNNGTKSYGSDDSTICTGLSFSFYCINHSFPKYNHIIFIGLQKLFHFSETNAVIKWIFYPKRCPNHIKRWRYIDSTH